MCVFVCVSAFCMFVFGRSIRSPYLCIFSVRPNYRTSIDNGIDLNIPGPPTKAPAPNSHEKARAKPQTQCIRKNTQYSRPHAHLYLAFKPKALRPALGPIRGFEPRKRLRRLRRHFLFTLRHLVTSLVLYEIFHEGPYILLLWNSVAQNYD